jgi:hypothetical protein
VKKNAKKAHSLKAHSEVSENARNNEMGIYAARQGWRVRFEFVEYGNKYSKPAWAKVRGGTEF